MRHHLSRCGNLNRSSILIIQTVPRRRVNRFRKLLTPIGIDADGVETDNINIVGRIDWNTIGGTLLLSLFEGYQSISQGLELSSNESCRILENAIESIESSNLSRIDEKSFPIEHETVVVPGNDSSVKRCRNLP